MLRPFLLVLLLLALPALGQGFPVPGKPIRILVPYPAGGHSDIQSRIIASKLSASMAVPVVVDNRPGASTLVATLETIRSAPDGHTLLCTNNTLALLPHLLRVAPYDPVRDLTPVLHASASGMVLVVHESLPGRDLREILASARAHPQLSYGSAGAGSQPHLSGAQLSRLAGINMEHIPYKGSTDLARDLIAGRVQMAFDMAVTAISAAATGKVRLVGAATERRLAALPNLPTMRELGIDIASDTWLGFFGPAGLPAPVVEMLSEHMLRALKDPAVVEKFTASGSEVTGLPAAALLQAVRADNTVLGAQIRALGVKLD